MNGFRVFWQDVKIRRAAILYSLGLFLLLSIPTALLSNPIIPYIRMNPATPLDYFFLVTTSLLGGMYLALPKRSPTPDQACATGGGIAGFLAVSCPICIKPLVFVLGLGLAQNVVNPLRPLIGAISILLLGYALHRKMSGDGKK